MNTNKTNGTKTEAQKQQATAGVKPEWRLDKRHSPFGSNRSNRGQTEGQTEPNRGSNRSLVPLASTPLRSTLSVPFAPSAVLSKKFIHFRDESSGYLRKLLDISVWAPAGCASAVKS